MKDLVIIESGNVFATSKDIADDFEVKGGHRYVMTIIKKLIADHPEFGALNLLHSSYTSKQNKVLQCYMLTRDGFAMVAMGLTGSKAIKWKVKYLNAFNAMESALKKTPTTMDQLNNLVKRIEGNKEAASVAGRALHSYRKVKQQDADDFKSAVNQAQLALKI